MASCARLCKNEINIEGGERKQQQKKMRRTKKAGYWAQRKALGGIPERRRP
jgi:hypothetical protein